MSFEFRQAFEDALFVSLPAKRAEAREEAFREQNDRIKSRKDKSEAERFDAAELMTVAIVASASTEQVRALSARTRLHQDLVAEALLENRDDLDASQEELERLLREAYVLEDGRRVFKSHDGTSVIDEHGQGVGPGDVDPNAIEDHRPDAETYLARRNAHIALINRQTELLAYQAHLDKFDTAVQAGNLTASEFAEMEAFMDQNAPAAILAKLPANDPAALANADTVRTLSALVHFLSKPETLRLLEDSLDQHRAFKEMVEAAEAGVK